MVAMIFMALPANHFGGQIKKRVEHVNEHAPCYFFGKTGSFTQSTLFFQSHCRAPLNYKKLKPCQS